jgi:1-acyl-sn-glycerol-3-phosphate acyltransferase
MEPETSDAAGVLNPVMARAMAASDAYDPESRQWGLLKSILWVYKTVCVRAVHVVGRQHIVEGSRILVSNHARVSDSFLLPFIFGRLHGMAQAESFTLPILGKLLARAGQVPIAPGRGREALNRARELLLRGETILIYPEGRLTHGAEMIRGKTGAARLSFESGAPMQPVAVHVPEKYSHTLHGRFYERPTIGAWQFGGPAYVAIGPAWRPFPEGASATARELRRATDEIMARLAGLLENARSAAGLR